MSQALRITRAITESQLKRIVGTRSGVPGKSSAITIGTIRPAAGLSISRPGRPTATQFQRLTDPRAPGNTGYPAPSGPSVYPSQLVAGGSGTGMTAPQAPGITEQLCSNLPSYLQGLCRSAAGYVGDQFGPGQGGTSTNGTGATACPPGTFKVQGRCVAPGDAFPGGDPFTFQAGGQAVQGSFGLPGVTPTQEQRRHLSCPPGMVLGMDELCYPKAVLPRRSQFRKWKGDRRPPVSVSDMQAIRQADRAKGRVKKLASQVGFSTKKR